MSATAIELTGTLREDGTLVLDEKPALPPGRVRIVLEIAAPSPSTDSLTETLSAIWAGQAARGHVPRTKEEVDAEIRALRDEWDEREDEFERIRKEARLKRERSEGEQPT